MYIAGRSQKRMFSALPLYSPDRPKKYTCLMDFVCLVIVIHDKHLFLSDKSSLASAF
jgi:hypothetical protein